MKINKYSFLSFLLSIVLPILGVILSIVKFDKKNTKAMVFNISLFIFFLMCFLPPYQDLFRRYTETYYYFNDLTTLKSVILGHVDILFYTLTYLIYQLGLPFYIVPAFLSAMTVYLFLNGVYLYIFKNEITHHNYRLILILWFFFLPIVQMALGVRWGAAISLAFYGVSLFIFSNKRGKGILFLVLSCLMHFSMILIVGAFIASRFIKLNRLGIVLLSIVSFSFSKLVLPVILSHMGFLGTYANTGYADNELANNTGNTNTIIVTIISFFYLIYFSLCVFIKWKSKFNEEYLTFRNFVFWLLVFIMLTSVSYVPFRRYLTGVFAFYICATYFMMSANINKLIFKNITIIVLVFCFIFNGVYLQRRAIILGELWTGLYKSPIFLLDYTQSEYNLYLKEIDEDGDWVGHKVKSN